MAEDDDRVGVTFSFRVPPDIADQVDLLIDQKRYPTRTSVAKTALIQFVTKEELMSGIVENIREFLDSDEFEKILEERIRSVLKKSL